MALFSNVRFYSLVFSFLLSAGVWFYTTSTIPEGSLQIIRSTQIYALIAITYLYLALLAGPLTYVFYNLPFKASYLKARRALGVSAFYFALIHAKLAFFDQLGGFSGLGFLSGNFLIAVLCSSTALLILALMAGTSFDFVIRWMTFTRWKFLHRFVYIAGILILIHALLLGTHFQDLSTQIPTIFGAALLFLMVLEVNRFDYFLQTKFPNLPKVGIGMIVFLLLLGGYLVLVLFPSNSSAPLSLGIHAAHIQLAKDAQNLNNNPPNLPNLPSLQGDKTKRFSMSFLHPDQVNPNKDVTLTFPVYEASSGNQVLLFQKVYDKTVHLVIVDSQLKYFNHIHPEQQTEGFSITTQFPHPGQYHLYLSFQPAGAIEQQFAFSLNVGDFDQPTFSTDQPDTDLTKVFDKYQVTLSYPSPLQSSSLSIGTQTLNFKLEDSVTHQPITTLKPYLAAFGHLVMINESSFDYIHVHPTTLVTQPDQSAGPTVEFMPLGLYGPIKPGIYRVFAQFNPDNNLFTADFTIEIK